MKKKVVIEKVPTKSSKKKVVIESLPKAQGGGDNFYYTPETRLAQTPSYYDWSKSYSQDNMLSVPEAGNVNKTMLPKKDAYNINLGKVGKGSIKKQSKLSDEDILNILSSNIPTILTGDKYINRASTYASNLAKDIAAFSTLANSKFKKPIDFVKHPEYLGYSPNFIGGYYGYANGGLLPIYQDAGVTPMVGGDISTQTQWQPTYDEIPLENLQPQTSLLPTKSNLELLGEPNLQKAPDQSLSIDKGNQQGTAQGIALGAKMLADTVGLTANVSKKALSTLGDKNLINQYKKAQSQLPAIARMSAVESSTLPTSFQGQNQLAADGMQIKQIGGYGEPNVEVEGEEGILLPNGFSQEIKGKKHSEGGIPLNLPSGTKIFSEKLKVPVKFLKELIEVNPQYAFLKNIKLPEKGMMSYADLAKKFETKKYVDLLNSKDADPIQKATAQLMINKNNQSLEAIFALQEQNKLSGVHGPQVQQNAEQELAQSQEQQEEPMMKYGGLYKAQDGKYWNTGYNYLDDIKLKQAFPQYKERGAEFFKPFSRALEQGNVMLNPIVQRWVIQGQGYNPEQGTYGNITERDVRDLENQPGFSFMKNIAEKYEGKGAHFDPTNPQMVRDYEDIVNATYEAEGLPPYFKNLTDPKEPFSKELKFGNWHASVAPVIRKSIGPGKAEDSTTEAVRYVVQKPSTVKQEEEQPADEMPSAKGLAMQKMQQARMTGSPFGNILALPLYGPDSVYAGDFMTLDPNLVEAPIIQPYTYDIDRAIRAGITNATDLSGTGIAQRLQALGTGMEEKGKRYQDASVRNAMAKYQADLANAQAKTEAQARNQAIYADWVNKKLQALGALGTQQGLRETASQADLRGALKEANTIQALRDAYFPAEKYNTSVADAIQITKYGGKVKPKAKGKIKIKPKLKK